MQSALVTALHPPPCIWTHAMSHRYFDEISQDTGKYCFGVDDTLQCLDMGAVETLIVWENLEVRLLRFACLRSAADSTLGPQVNRHVLVNRQTEETFIKHLTPEQEKDTSHFVDKDTGTSPDLQQLRAMAPRLTPCRASPQAWSLSRRKSCRCWSGSQTSTSALAASLSACMQRCDIRAVTHRRLASQVCD